MSTPQELSLQVLRAAERLRDRIVRTPVVASPWLSAAVGSEVRCKLETVQHTGSFKVRGATNAMALLAPEVRRRGIVAASSGNHGLGVAAAALELGVPALVLVPETTAPAKQAAIRKLGAEVQPFGADCVDTERQARQVAGATGRHYLSPYNDLDVVAGQGTVAVELLEQWPDVEVVYVALGGGGLISGMAAYGKSVRPEVEFVACSPLQSNAMAECVRRGAIVDVPCGETWSDSTAGGVEPGAVTFPLCQQLVDRYLDLDEASIEAALLGCLEHQHLLVEGAAAVAVAACLADPELRGRRAAVIVCGANLPFSRLRSLLRR